MRHGWLQHVEHRWTSKKQFTVLRECNLLYYLLGECNLLLLCAGKRYSSSNTAGGAIILCVMNHTINANKKQKKTTLIKNAMQHHTVADTGCVNKTVCLGWGGDGDKPNIIYNMLENGNGKSTVSWRFSRRDMTKPPPISNSTEVSAYGPGGNHLAGRRQNLIGGTLRGIFFFTKSRWETEFDWSFCMTLWLHAKKILVVVPGLNFSGITKRKWLVGFDRKIDVFRAHWIFSGLRGKKKIQQFSVK